MRGWEGMKDGHIQFEDWEPEEALDQQHLRSCSRCREEYQQVQFLREIAASAPTIDAPPFFASRVAQIAIAGTRSFWDLFDRMARRMAPLFASLVLVTAFLLYSQQQRPVDQPEVDSLAWLAGLEEVPVPETLDEMLLVLAQTEWEEAEDDAEQH